MRSLPAALALLVAATAPAADRHRVPEARPSGPAVSCIRLSDIRESRVRDDRTIDFVATGRRAYRNTLPYDCPRLGFERRFAHETSLGQLCSTDIITVLEEPGPSRGPSCGLGPFQPVTLGNR